MQDEEDAKTSVERTKQKDLLGCEYVREIVSQSVGPWSFARM